MRKAVSLALLAALSLVRPVFAQDHKPDAELKPEDHRFYRLDFVVREIGEDGKIVNSRVYSIISGSDEAHPQSVQASSIRTGSKVPVAVSGSSMTQYVDVGVSIDCSELHLVQNQLSLHVISDVSSLPDGSPTGSSRVVRQNKWESEVVLPLGKATVLFSSDNVASKGKLQLELTATPIK